MRRLVLAAVTLAMAAAGPVHAQAVDPATVAAPPPPVPTDHAAERYYDPAVMAAARRQLLMEHGGMTYSLVMGNIVEHDVGASGGGYRWEGQASFGGDIDRFVIRSEGEGSDRGGVDRAEVQALWSRAVGPYFNLQAGVRQDLRPHPSRTYATVGFEGLAPYWVEVSGALFLSNRGEVLGRLEGYYDQRITQRLILQPRAELNFAAQDIRETGMAAGLSDAELALRLRYEFTRRFAPYLGVSYDRKFGTAGGFARQAGERAEDTRLVLGLRAWF